MKRIGIFTATRWEYAAVRRILSDGRTHRQGPVRYFVGRRGRWEVVVAQTGVGSEKAAVAGRVVLHGQPLDLAVSAGLACALVPAQVGDILVGTNVRMEADDREGVQGAQMCAGEIAMVAVRAAERAGLPVKAGPFVTVPRILWHATEKQAMAKMTGPDHL